jgi:protein-disulfide isomerase
MKNKPGYRGRYQAQAARRRTRRYLILGGVVLAAVAVVAFLITQSPKPVPVTADSFVTPVPQNWPQANGKVLGPASAKVVLQEFADFQCPYCRQFHDTVLPQIISQYVANGKVRLEYHHLIVIDQNVGGTESRRAAEASECASAQGRFWDYFNLLFANQGTEGSGAFSDSRLKAFAGAVGLDSSQFNSCLDSSQAAAAVRVDEALALSRGLNGTPSILVNGQLVQNPLDANQVKAAIDAALKQALP